MPSPAFELSILIPARNEFYHDLDLLSLTVENVLANTSDKTQIIVVLDGYDAGWPPNPLPVNPRVTIIHHAKSVGQRAACNEAARASTAKYIAKLDAHCAIDKDFDTKLLREFEYDWTVVPAQYNLHVFDWKCKKCGERTYQGPKPQRCTKCGSRYFKQVVVWHPTDGTGRERGVSKGGYKNILTTSWRFDSKLEFQYWPEFKQRPEAKADIHDTMSLLGACWAMHRERYWELGGLDEQYGSWGQMGTELALKSWLSGGRLVTNKRTWFAHFFRTGGIGFPYSGGGQKGQAMARCAEIWLNDKWPKAKYPLSWLIKKFAPIPDWKETKPTKCALLYTCNSHDETLELAARANLKRATNGHELGVVALQRTDFGDWTIVVNREKSGGTMHYQILAGLERSTADYVFLCESDVMYSPSHFEFTPPRDDTVYYNTNVWRVRWQDGHAVRTANLQQVSGICASRQLLVDHYRKRVSLIDANGGIFDTKRMAYEPGTRGDLWGVKVANWESPYPNLDITGHGNTLTTPHFSVESFRNKKFAQGWRETDGQIDGWPLIYGRVQEWLKEMADGG